MEKNEIEGVKETYYLKATWQKEWTKVSRKQFIEAEREAGFYPKGSCGVATAGFSHGSVEGRVDYQIEEIPEKKGEKQL